MRNQIAAACQEVDGLLEERLLNTDPDALATYFGEKYGVEVPALDRENLSASHHEREVAVHDHWDGRTISVPGEAYDFELPFSGDPAIFKLRPNAFDTSPPEADISGHLVRFTIAGRQLDPARVKGEVDGLVASIEKYLGWHRTMWAAFPAELAREVRRRIDERRDRLLRQKGAAAQLAGMGIRLKEKASDARTYVTPTVKKRIEPRMPPMRPASPPEPTLDQKQYDTILGLIRDAGHSVEQSSSRMRELDEEALRDIFLVPLNAHFGSATGEAFNHQGKTDVLIRHQGGNLFVAEFKIWGGDKRFLATIDQLLGYLTWRDTKAAIVMFSRNDSFSAVVAKIRELAKSHPRCIAGPTRLDETSDRYEFSLPQDDERRVTISILPFDLST
ncbi:hypothetical protein NF701_08985 [Sphingomonadaceae bacterium OTU29THOMA1]|nr:hypothetical protein NF701_08985 [Sphingomonadaceae bacterium OTU29THOMA1]